MKFLFVLLLAMSSFPGYAAKTIVNPGYDIPAEIEEKLRKLALD